MTDPQQPAKWETTKRVAEHGAMKMMSARWFCTIAAMWVWAYLAYQNVLPPAFHSSIITLIVTSYFGKTKED